MTQGEVAALLLEHPAWVPVLKKCMNLPFLDSLGWFAGKWIQNGNRHLRHMADAGLLEKGNLTRGGRRRYYRIKDSALLQKILEVYNYEN